MSAVACVVPGPGLCKTGGASDEVLAIACAAAAVANRLVILPWAPSRARTPDGGRPGPFLGRGPFGRLYGPYHSKA